MSHRADRSRWRARLLAAGADLSPWRLLQAYQHGIFPWYSEGQPILWWSTDPRMVLDTERFKISASLKKTLRRIARSRAEGGPWQVKLSIPRSKPSCVLAPRRAGTARNLDFG
jgi:leucyl/phenylalanyl-tRNA--protein transferase